MNISKLFEKLAKPTEAKYVKASRRGFASAIDFWIVLLLRVVALQILGKLWFEKKILILREDFIAKFGTEVPKKTPEHLNFIIHSDAFLCAAIIVLIIVLIGAFYHSYFNSSAWQGTIGKRLMKILIVKEDEEKISFSRASAHYFLSILPLIFIAYLLSYKARYQVTFFQAITASEFNIFLAIVLAGWLQIHLFTKKKTTAYDLICGTILINGKSDKKFPWSK
ncbi:MAG: RDD family protein [Rickettsiales bacterium]|nr:RDD family protein [Rickettsiales bacterium]